MVTTGMMVMALGVFALVAGLRFASRWALSAGVFILLYAGSWAVWSVLIVLNLLPIYPLLRQVNPPWNTIVFFGPPLVPALLLAWFGGRWMAGRLFPRGRSG